MSYIFDERPDSTWNLAENKGNVSYQLFGTDGEYIDEASALNYASFLVPFRRNGAWLQDIVLNHQGNGLWYIEAPYGSLPKMPGSLRISSRTTGGTVHIASAKSMVAKYGSGAPDRVIIGQNGEGAEITVPVQVRQYTYNFPKAVVTEAMMDYWEDLTGVVNLNQWHNRAAGEVLFLGCEADTTIAADSASSVTFNMAMSRNKTGITIGSITSIAKEGHDLIDVHMVPDTSGGVGIQIPKYVYVQRVYDRLDFGTYFGF